jgi:hypothetical protein
VENGPNVFTDLLPISIENVSPQIQLKETDAAVDGRFWRHGVNSGLFAIQSLTDALVSTNLLTLDRFGALNLTQNTDHIFGGSVGASVNRVRIKNTVSGVDRIASLIFDTDIGGMGTIHGFTSGYTSSGWNVAAGLTISCSGIGGINIAAANVSAGITFYTGLSASPTLLLLAAGGGSLTNPVVNTPTLTLRRSAATATSGSMEGSILFTGPGIQHAAIGYIPFTGGASRVFVGFGGSNNPAAFTKNIQCLDFIVLPSNTTFVITGNSPTGMMVISSITHNKSGLFILNASGSVSFEVADPGNLFAITPTAGMLSVAYGGSGTWILNNQTGGQITVSVTMIGQLN